MGTKPLPTWGAPIFKHSPFFFAASSSKEKVECWKSFIGQWGKKLLHKKSLPHLPCILTYFNSSKKRGGFFFLLLWSAKSVNKTNKCYFLKNDVLTLPRFFTLQDFFFFSLQNFFLFSWWMNLHKVFTFDFFSFLLFFTNLPIL